MSELKNIGFDTKCIHAGIGEYEHGPVVPPIYQTSTFKFESAEHGGSLFKGEQKGYIYTRMLNPTIEAMEDAIAALENGNLMSLMEVNDKDELVIITTHGMVIRQGVKAIRVMGRNTQGVRVINLKDGDSIADIAKVVVEDVNGNGNGNDNTENKDANKDDEPTL